MFRQLRVLTGIAAVVAAATAGTVLPAAASTTSPNLIVNGGAEQSAGSSDGSVVPVPDWNETTGNSFTAVQYGASGDFPTATDPGPAHRGKNFLAGGPGGNPVVAVQTLKLKPYDTAIKGGKATFQLSGFLGGYQSQTDSAFVELDFKNSAGDLIGTSATLGPVTAAMRNDKTGLIKQVIKGKVPKAARTAYLQLSLSGGSGSYNTAYADNLVFTIVSP